MTGVRVHGRGDRCLVMPRVRICRGRCRRVLRRRRRAVVVSAGAAGRSQPALGVEQEYACSHDPLAFLEPAADFHAIRQLHAERHRARLESIAGGDEHVLLETGVHDGVARHGDHDLSRRCKGRRSIQARSEAAARIGRRKADAQRARAVGEHRIDEVHMCSKWLAPRRREIELRERPDANARNICLGHFCEHPDARQVRNREQRRGGIDRRAHGHPAIHDHAAPRCDDGDQPSRFPALLDGVDFGRRHPEHREARSPAGDHRARDTRRGRVPSRRQVLGLRRQQFLGEDAGQRLTRRDHLAGGIDVELFDPARHPRMHVRDARFIRHDGRDRARLLRQ